MKNPSTHVVSAVQLCQPRNRSKLAAAVIAVLMFASVVMPSYGQDSGDDVSVLMEEIVVTARKREESIQDAPLAVSAFTGTSLQARGIEKIDGIAAITPNMSFDNINTNGGGGSNASVYIRGVGQTDFIPSADPGVGLYVDGAYLARSIGAILDLIDIERVEVLRGPQGTLFGRNTIGGAVSIHTIKPHSEFESKVKVKLGSDDRQDISGRVNLPITDNLFTSFSVAKFEQDGFVKNPITGDDTGDDDTIAFRGALRWQASDNLLIDISADYSEDDENGQPRVSTSDPSRAVAFIPPDSPTGTGNGGFQHNFFLGANSPFAGPNAPFPPQGIIRGLRQFNNCDATPGNIEGTNNDCANASTVGLGENTGTEDAYYEADIWGVAATIEWDVTETIRIKSITAYRDLDSEFGHDGDNSPFYLSWVRDEYEQEQFSQELQLLGTSFDGSLDWILGAYYFDEEGSNFNPVDFAAIDIESGGDFDNESEAFFAQGTYHFLERWHFTAGIRYTDDTKDFIVIGDVQTAVPVLAPPPVGRVTLIDNGTTTLDADDWTPMYNLAFDWTDDFMVYANYAEGFKSGGVQQRNAGVFGPKAPTYDPEYVDSYEVGFKFSSADGSFVLNGAGFFADYTDIQLETLAPEGIAPQLENAGEAEIKGVELESRWAPTNNLFFELAVGYVDAEITDADSDATDSGGPAKGDTVPYVPEWNYAVSAIYIWDLADWGTVTPRVDYSWRDDVFFSPDNDPGNTQESYGIWNASVSWNSPNNRYGVNAHWLNIADEDYILYTEISGSSATGNDILGREEEWYITAEVRF